MPLDASRLDRQIDLYHRVLTRNTQGEQVPSWPDAYATVWADVNELRGARRFETLEYFSEQMTEITIRFRTDLLMTDRIIMLETSQLYEILQAAEIGRHHGLNLLCRAIVK
jgi:SPP1 family predicted phage head-tail adaptor